MTTAELSRAARATAGASRRSLAGRCVISQLAFQPIKASDGTIRGPVKPLAKLAAAVNSSGSGLDGDGLLSRGAGRDAGQRSHGAAKAKSSLAAPLYPREVLGQGRDPQWR